MLLKLCLGVLDRIISIGLVAKNLLVPVWGEGFSQCRPYIVIIIVDWITSWILGGGINWFCHIRILRIVMHEFPLIKFWIFKKGILLDVSCIIRRYTVVEISCAIHIQLLWFYCSYYQKNDFVIQSVQGGSGTHPYQCNWIKDWIYNLEDFDSKWLWL